MLTPDRIRACRADTGFSMMQAKRACQIADERFDGDDELGAAWMQADTLAVNVRGDRAAWNDQWARQKVATRKAASSDGEAEA
ncbi:hypothetical protein [Erythrobacter aureus]|uniref:Uncharacterized protein n=1 Tax=Erythrobacter aureus TaxID=2182384 RepID=A0A345YIU4_9SPHN|nr:hypothetical protein [Erythrobacter aureus]AXK43846.1 hypothetical protein DVR09_15440 [Erythrobacter aureus]